MSQAGNHNMRKPKKTRKREIIRQKPRKARRPAKDPFIGVIGSGADGKLSTDIDLELYGPAAEKNG
jgi:hypothetical protein